MEIKPKHIHVPIAIFQRIVNTSIQIPTEQLLQTYHTLSPSQRHFEIFFKVLLEWCKTVSESTNVSRCRVKKLSSDLLQHELSASWLAIKQRADMCVIHSTSPVILALSKIIAGFKSLQNFWDIVNQLIFIENNIYDMNQHQEVCVSFETILSYLISNKCRETLGFAKKKEEVKQEKPDSYLFNDKNLVKKRKRMTNIEKPTSFSTEDIENSWKEYLSRISQTVIIHDIKSLIESWNNHPVSISLEIDLKNHFTNEKTSEASFSKVINSVSCFMDVILENYTGPIIIKELSRCLLSVIHNYYCNFLNSSDKFTARNTLLKSMLELISVLCNSPSSWSKILLSNKEEEKKVLYVLLSWYIVLGKIYYKLFKNKFSDLFIQGILYLLDNDIVSAAKNFDTVACLMVENLNSVQELPWHNQPFGKFIVL